MSGFVFKFEYYTRFIFRKFDQSEYTKVIHWNKYTSAGVALAKTTEPKAVSPINNLFFIGNHLTSQTIIHFIKRF
jgi:hypothetical protein